MEQNVGHILLIDDDEINNFLSREIITLYYPGTNVQSFTDAYSGLEYIQEKIITNASIPGIILLDINMPKMNGWEFLDSLNEPVYRNKITSTIYIYTSSVYDGDIAKARSFSLVKKLLSKPLSKEVLDEIMR
ncbi:MAG: response regulator [Ferruginibacter sp.]